MTTHTPGDTPTQPVDAAADLDPSPIAEEPVLSESVPADAETDVVGAETAMPEPAEAASSDDAAEVDPPNGIDRMVERPMIFDDPELQALADADPAQAPELADAIADDLAARLERARTDAAPAAAQRDDAAQADVIPGDVIPGDVIPGDVIPGDVIPGDVIQGDVIPGGGSARS